MAEIEVVEVVIAVVAVVVVVGERPVVGRSMTVEGGTLRNGSQSGKPHHTAESLMGKKRQLGQIIQTQQTREQQSTPFLNLVYKQIENSLTWSTWLGRVRQSAQREKVRERKTRLKEGKKEVTGEEPQRRPSLGTNTVCLVCSSHRTDSTTSNITLK